MVLDLNYYMNRTLEVVMKDKTIHVRQPSMAIHERINQVEEDLTGENMPRKRAEVLKILLDNNLEGIQLTVDELMNYPLHVADDLMKRLNDLYAEAELDPN